MKESSSFLLIKDPLQLCLTHFDINEFDCDSYTREVNTLLDSLKSSIPPWTISYELLLDLAKELILSSIQSPPQLELKPLPSTLKYVFLELKDTLPVIIVVCLTPDQENQLIDVLKQHKGAIGWSMANLKEISPSICMHRICCKDNTNPSTDMQRLNPCIREVVKEEVAK